MSTAMESLRPAHRIDYDELCRLYETGVLDPDTRVELINGEIIDMEAPGVDHSWAVDCLCALFRSSLGDAVVIRAQGPLLMDRWNFLLPDILLLKGPLTRYRRRHPSVNDVLLVVEISDTTLRRDLKIKLPLYSAHGAREAWILDVVNLDLHIHRASEGEGSSRTLKVTRSSTLALHAQPDLQIDLSPPLEV